MCLVDCLSAIKFVLTPIKWIVENVMLNAVKRFGITNYLVVKRGLPCKILVD